jgi:hypothetical protein
LTERAFYYIIYVTYIICKRDKNYTGGEILSRKDEYREYLQGEQWAGIRADVYRDAGGACVVCLSDAEAVHHRYYPDNLEDDTTAGKMAVCDRCHKAIHGIQPKRNERQEIIRIITEAVADMEPREQAECFDKLVQLYYRGRVS